MKNDRRTNDIECTATHLDFNSNMVYTTELNNIESTRFKILSLPWFYREHVTSIRGCKCPSSKNLNCNDHLRWQRRGGNSSR